jgi:beta-galactosidase
MNGIMISSDTGKETLSISGERLPRELRVLDSAGQTVETPVIQLSPATIVLDAARLHPWTPDTPVLYTLEADGCRLRFGYVDIRPDGAGLRVNGAPFYFRGYIRGITAHDHPNMTGGSKRDYFEKNIRQAKKYGFNLVRFHSTIPDPEYVELADELGLFIHMEIGYRHEYGADGSKKGIIIDEKRWRETILRFRNHPSVAIFCLGNEMHNSGRNPEAHRMYRLGRELAPDKLIVDNAGWGEFDRESADAFIQHIAYYFPHKKHAAMFGEDFCWRMNGSVAAVPLEAQSASRHGAVSVRRRLNPVRPVLAHECVHYIDIPDYAELNRRFDTFAARVGDAYLKTNGIEKPRYLEALPKLIAEKGLESKMPDYIAASRHFKKLAVKTYLEQLRLASNFAGFEILQLSDCLKYENKNGVIDLFDDDKFIAADWMRQFNDDVVLLADMPKDAFRSGETFTVPIHLSNFAGAPLGRCRLTLRLDAGNGEAEQVYSGEQFLPVQGVAKLVDANFTLSADAATAFTLEGELDFAGRRVRNQWLFHVYPKPAMRRPGTISARPELETFLKSAAGAAAPELALTDTLGGHVLDWLAAGKTVLLNYHRDRTGNTYYLQSTLDRFKPCIWDRGSHLGGVLDAAWLSKAMGVGRYFEKSFYHLVEGACKINLEHCPFPVDELVWGVDKPVRDRMKGLIRGVKDFIAADTLRNFSYLFSVRVGPGTLVACGFDFSAAESEPAVAAALAAILDYAATARPKHSVTPDKLRVWLEESTAKGVVPEDVMNHFWEIDNKPVEDTLFWEEARCDLGKMSRSADK